jgi:hypothetical protein
MTITQYLPALQKHKEDNGCADCGIYYPHYVLEFDHRPGTKKIGNVYHVLKKYGEKKGWAEVAKCDVVCSNCHKIRSFERQEALSQNVTS